MTKQHQKNSPDIELLRARRSRLEAHQHTVDGQPHTDSIGNRQGQEIAHDVIANEIVEANSQIEELAAFLAEDPAHMESGITIGQVVTIRIDEDEPTSFLLVSKLGGQELLGKTTLNCESPVGKALLGRAVGDKFQVDVEHEQLTVEVIQIQAFA